MTATQTQTPAITKHNRPTPAVEAWLKADPKRTLAITITGLKHMAALSEETHAYSATVLIDGVRAFSASNHGTGGPDMYHEIQGYAGPSAMEVEAWLCQNTPKIPYHGIELDNSLEIIVGDLINDELGRKHLTRMLKTKIIVIDEDGGQPALFTYKGKPTAEALADMKRLIAAGKVKGRLVNGGDEAVLAEARKLI